MGEAKRREELGLHLEKRKGKTNIEKSTNKFLTNILITFYLGFSLLAILIIDLVNYYK